jgi:apolipoprotein N-acyltransferase
MLRATNTGMTAAIDAHGRVIDVVPSFTRGELDTDVQPMTGDTPYSAWTDWPLWLLCGFAVLVSMIFVVRAGRTRRLG